jgi:hypothetical protein
MTAVREQAARWFIRMHRDAGAQPGPDQPPRVGV